MDIGIAISQPGIKELTEEFAVLLRGNCVRHGLLEFGGFFQAGDKLEMIESVGYEEVVNLFGLGNTETVHDGQDIKFYIILTQYG